MDTDELNRWTPLPSQESHTVELAFAVGAQHRGRRRAVAVVPKLARRAGANRAVLTIATDNVASQATAAPAGLVKSEAPLRRRERKGFVLMMTETWKRELA